MVGENVRVLCADNDDKGDGEKDKIEAEVEEND